MKKVERTIFIPIETAVRELDGKLLVAFYLIEKGYRVIIGSRRGVFRELNHYSKALFLAKSVSKEHENIYKKIRFQDCLTVVQNVEGGILTKDESGHFKNSYPVECIPYIDKYYLFGSKIKESFIQNIKEISPDKLVISGDPRFDLLKTHYREYYQERVNQIKRKYGDSIILINTSFSIANPYVGEEQLFRFMEKNSGYNEQTINNLKLKNKFYKPIMHTYIQAVKQIANSNPDSSFIIRPHPSESLVIYQNEFHDFNNVYVSNDGNVHIWILACKGVIHYDCTTGIEAILANKPTIAFVPDKNDEVFAWLPAYLSDQVATIDELNDKVQSILANQYEVNLSEEKTALLQSYIARFDKDGAAIIADSIDDLFLQKKINASEINNISKLYYHRFLDFLRKTKRTLIAKPQSISEKKLGDLRHKEISQRLHKLAVLLDSKKHIKVTNKGKNTLLLEA